MQSIDKKVTLILKLNAKIKRLDLYLLGGVNVPKFMQKDYSNASIQRDYIFNVLTNLNYINY